MKLEVSKLVNDALECNLNIILGRDATDRKQGWKATYWRHVATYVTQSYRREGSFRASSGIGKAIKTEDADNRQNVSISGNVDTPESAVKLMNTATHEVWHALVRMLPLEFAQFKEYQDGKPTIDKDGKKAVSYNFNGQIVECHVNRNGTENTVAAYGRMFNETMATLMSAVSMVAYHNYRVDGQHGKFIYSVCFDS